jgi:hypothetical protein
MTTVRDFQFNTMDQAWTKYWKCSRAQDSHLPVCPVASSLTRDGHQLNNSTTHAFLTVVAYSRRETERC